MWLGVASGLGGPRPAIDISFEQEQNKFAGISVNVAACERIMEVPSTKLFQSYRKMQCLGNIAFDIAMPSRKFETLLGDPSESNTFFPRPSRGLNVSWMNINFLLFRRKTVYSCLMLATVSHC